MVPCQIDDVCCDLGWSHVAPDSKKAVVVSSMRWLGFITYCLRWLVALYQFALLSEKIVESLTWCSCPGQIPSSNLLHHPPLECFVCLASVSWLLNLPLFRLRSTSVRKPDCNSTMFHEFCCNFAAKISWFCQKKRHGADISPVKTFAKWTQWSSSAAKGIGFLAPDALCWSHFDYSTKLVTPSSVQRGPHSHLRWPLSSPI